MYFKTLVVILTAFLFSSCTPNAELADKYFQEGLDNFQYHDYKVAILKFKKSLEYNPSSFEAHYHIGNCYINLRNYNSAVDEFTKAIEVKNNYADAYANRGQAYFYLHEKSKSCADFKKANELGKPNMEDRLRHCD